MRFYLILLLMALVHICLISCKRQETRNSSFCSSGLINTIQFINGTNYTSQTKYNLESDNQRFSNVTFIGEIGTTSVHYLYRNDTLIIQSNYYNGKSDSLFFIVNQAGYMESGFGHTAVYDSYGQILKTSNNDFEWDNGNLVKRINVFNDTSIFQYEYISEAPGIANYYYRGKNNEIEGSNAWGINQLDSNYDIVWVCKPCKDLLNKIKISKDGVHFSDYCTYSYSINATSNNLIERIDYVYSDPNLNQKYTINTYSCY